MLLTKELEIKWHGSNRKYYESKGYVFTGNGTTFTCKIEDALRTTKYRIQCKCDYCGKTYEKYFCNYDKNRKFLKKDACSECNPIKLQEVRKIKYKRINTQKAKDTCKEKGYEMQDFEYIDSSTKVPFICPYHREKGVQYMPYKQLINQGNGCRYCAREKTIASYQFTYEDAKRQIEENGKNKLLSTSYTKCKDWNLEISCEECGKSYVTSLDYFKRGKKTRCNECSCSMGEKSIIEYLKRKNITYEHDCYEIYPKEREYPLRFDFYINDLRLAIEYDGEQHYFPVNFNHYDEDELQENFKNLKIRDNIKNNYCVENNITLIRIPYWERENIESILDNYFDNDSKEYVIK